MVNVVNRIETQYAVTGLDSTMSSLDRIAAAEQRLAAQSASLSTASAGLDRSTLSVQRSLDAITRSLDPASKAQATYERALNLANKATAQGIPLTDANTRALANAKNRVDELAKSVTGSAHAHGEHGAAVSLNGAQLAEFGHILRSITDELAAGISPMQAFRSEGARIAQAFSEGQGGVGGTIKALGSGIAGATTKVLGFVNPWTLAGAAVVGFAGIAYNATSSIRALNDAMDKSVSGAGRLAGLSGGGLNSLAGVSSANTGNSLADSRTNAEALASSGKFDAGNISGILGLTKGYAATYGGGVGEAGGKLADIFADPVKGLDTLNERLGFLDAGTREYVKSLQAQGDVQGAVKAAVEAASASLNEQVRPGGPLDRFMAFWTKRSAELDASIASALAPPTPLEQYRSASRSGGRPGRFRFGAASPDVDDGTNNIAEDLRNQSIAAGSSPLQKSPQQVVLDNALSLREAAAQQITKESQLTVASIEATTFAEKTAANYQKNYTEALDRTTDALQAAATAEGRRNEAIATSNKQAQDFADKQAQSDALLGLKPAQRLALERQQSIDNAGIDGGIVGGGNGSVATTSMVQDASARTGIPAAIITAIGQKENSGRLTGGTTMLGSDGRPSSAWGFGQLTNGAARDVAGVVPGFDKYDPNTAVFGSAEYLKILAGRNNGDMTAALNAYGGTQGYAADIMRRAGGVGALPASTTAVSAVTNGGVSSTGTATLTTAANDHYGSQYAQLEKAPIVAATDALTQQNAALDIQAKTLGMTAGAIATMNERQALLNTYAASGVTVTASLSKQINTLADGYGAAAQRQADILKGQKDLIGAMDGVRSAADQGLGTFIDDLVKGKGLTVAIRDVLAGLGQDILKLGEQSLVDSLFGKAGTTGGSSPLGGGLSSILGSVFGGGGLFGGLFGGPAGGAGGIGHNADGTDNWRGGPTVVGERGPEIVNLPKGAQVVPNSAIGGRAPSISLGGHTIVIQGSADKDTAAMIDQKLAAANAKMLKDVQRNFGTLSGNYAKRYG